MKIRWDGARRTALVALVIGLLGCVATLFGVAGDSTQAYASWLYAYALFLSLALGSLFFVLIHHITGARWGVTVRRLAEAAMSTLPVFAILFIPVVVGMHDLFHWTHEDVRATDPLVQWKSAYLDVTFFYVRAIAYFVIWTGIAVYMMRQSVAQDAGDGLARLHRMKWSSAPAMLLFGLTITFAAFDWLMSLSPHWFSTIFGVYYFSGAIQGALAMLVVLALALQRAGYLRGVVTVEHYHDLGKLLFGFTVFFAYIAFSQYFLIWYANIPEETFWFLYRWGPWQGVSIALVFFTFVLPFFVLLSRASKRIAPILLLGAVITLIGRAIDMYWLVFPSLQHGAEVQGPNFTWMNVTALIGIGGVFVAALCWQLGKNALVPVGDPLLRASMGHENV